MTQEPGSDIPKATDSDAEFFEKLERYNKRENADDFSARPSYEAAPLNPNLEFSLWDYIAAYYLIGCTEKFRRKYGSWQNRKYVRSDDIYPEGRIIQLKMELIATLLAGVLFLLFGGIGLIVSRVGLLFLIMEVFGKQCDHSQSHYWCTHILAIKGLLM